MNRIVITNKLDTGTAFGVDLDGDVGGGVFIPSKLAASVNAAIGDHLYGVLVPNAVYSTRTPWLAITLSRDPGLPLGAPVAAPVAAPQEEQEEPKEVDEVALYDRALALMSEGGVWNVQKLFNALFPGATRTGALRDYNATVAAIRRLFTNGKCAKFQLWSRVGQTKPGREWYTFHPEKADVTERQP